MLYAFGEQTSESLNENLLLPFSRKDNTMHNMYYILLHKTYYTHPVDIWIIQCIFNDLYFLKVLKFMILSNQVE